jgi:SAM-dependent methyltransferase
MTGFRNTYEDARRAAAYASLAYPGTYHLAFRDLPALLAAHVEGGRAVDFGCGAGRSTRFLRELGYHVVGVDISAEMIARARAQDPAGSYRLLEPEPGDVSGLGALPAQAFDLALAVFPFDNIPGVVRLVATFAGLRRLLAPAGKLVLVASAPELYVHEWVSFTTAAFPENRRARSGEAVRIVMLDVEDRRPVEDQLWTATDYHEQFRLAGLEPVETHLPLGREGEGYAWDTELRIAPWAVHVARRDAP